MKFPAQRVSHVLFIALIRTRTYVSTGYLAGHSEQMSKHRSIDLATKIAVIDAVEAGTRNKTEIAKSFSLPKSTLSTILKNKDRLRESYATASFDRGRKRLRLAAHPDIEEVLFSWFKQARCMNVPISGPILKVKAKELALKLGHFNFACSTGWLERFKSRHSIVFRRVTGEEGAVSEDMVMDWNSNQLPLLLTIIVAIVMKYKV